MHNTVTTLLGSLLLLTFAPRQQPPRELQGAGHVLGETAEHFFSAGAVGELLHACQAADWKTVKQLAKTVDPASKPIPKDICSRALLIRKLAMSGARQEYGDSDDKTMRTDTFTLDGGQLVKIAMVFHASTTDVEGFHPKTFAELFDGLREAYGEPSSSSTEPVLDVYGVKYDAHRAQWLGEQNIISINELPGRNGRTEIIVETLAEHDRAAKAPKAVNPLQPTVPPKP